MPRRFFALIAVLLTGCASAMGQSAQRFTFGLIGDIGYLPLSSPRYSCTDEMLARRLAQFWASAHPLVFTPGDNDWTDCHDPGVPGGNPRTLAGTSMA